MQFMPTPEISVVVPAFNEEQPLSTQNLAVQRSAYEAIGSFDRRITCSLALDDVDLTLRLSQKNPIRVIPDLAENNQSHELSTGNNCFRRKSA